MRARSTIAGIMLGIGLLTPLWAHAVDIGQFCFQLTPFADQLVIGVNTVSGPYEMYSLTSQWTGGLAYRLGGSGESVRGNPDPTLDLDVLFINRSEFFGGSGLCIFRGVYAAAGAWSLTCIGTDPPFEANGTLTQVGCPFPPASAEDAWPLAGDAPQ